MNLPKKNLGGSLLNLPYGAMVGYLFLLISWGIMLIMLMAFTEGWLVPWDTYSLRPPVGGWERTINDFFEGMPGAILPTLLILSPSLAMYGTAWRQTKYKASLTWGFVVVNSLFLGAEAFLSSWAITWNATQLPQPRPLMDVGYHLTWPALAVTGCLCLVLWGMQGGIALFWGRKKISVKSH